MNKKQLEPPDKPVQHYENVLFMCYIVIFFVCTINDWQGFIVAGLVFATGVLLVSLSHLLFPPRYSNTRAVYVLGSLMGYIILLQKLFRW